MCWGNIALAGGLRLVGSSIEDASAAGDILGSERFDSIFGTMPYSDISGRLSND